MIPARLILARLILARLILILARLILARLILARLILARLILAQLILAQLILARLNLAGRTLAPLILARLILARLILVRLILARLILARRTLARLILARLILARLILARLTLVRLIQAQLALAHWQQARTRLILSVTRLLVQLALVRLTIARLALVLLTVARLTLVQQTLIPRAFARRTSKLTLVLLTQPVARKAAVAIFSAAPAFRATVTTAILVSINSVIAASFTTDTHRGCSGLPNEIIDNILIAGPPVLVDPDAAACDGTVGRAPAGYAAQAYTALLTLDQLAGTGSGSANPLNQAVRAFHDGSADHTVLVVHVGVTIATPAGTSTSTAAIAVVDNAGASGCIGIAANNLAVASYIVRFTVATTTAFVAVAVHSDAVTTIAAPTIEAIAANLFPGDRLRARQQIVPPDFAGKPSAPLGKAKAPAAPAAIHSRLALSTAAFI